MQLLKGKVAIVTGAALGIGAGVARLFAEEGAHVAVVDVDGAGARTTATGIESQGGSAFAFEADVRDRAALARMVDEIHSRFGHIDALVNNAGIYPRQSFLKMTDEEWDTMLDINLKGIFNITKLVLPHMADQHSGAIVNISSVTFFLGLANLTHYIASKGGIVGFTRALAREAGEYQVRVNCVTPGAIETEGEKATLTKETIDEFMAQQSLKRRIVPLDIARVCLFLCTDLSGAMTGQTLNVDGGWIMH